MNEEYRVAFEEVAGDLLSELGYPVGQPVEEARSGAGAPAES
jgi:hypothetical protein